MRREWRGWARAYCPRPCSRSRTRQPIDGRQPTTDWARWQLAIIIQLTCINKRRLPAFWVWALPLWSLDIYICWIPHSTRDLVSAVLDWSSVLLLRIPTTKFKCPNQPTDRPTETSHHILHLTMGCRDVSLGRHTKPGIRSCNTQNTYLMQKEHQPRRKVSILDAEDEDYYSILNAMYPSRSIIVELPTSSSGNLYQVRTAVMVSWDSRG